MKLSKNTSISMLPEEHIQALKTSYINLESADNKLSNFIDKKFITQLENEISSLEKIKKIQQKKQSVASDAALLQKKLEKKKTNFTSKLKKKIETHLDDTISPKIKSIQKILKHIQNSKIHESDIDFLKAHASHIIRDKAEYIVLASTLQLASKSYNDNYKSIQTQINSVTKENKDHNKTYQILKSNLLRTAESGFEQHLFIIEFFQENLHILEDKNSIIQEIIKHGEQDNVIIFEPTIEDALQVLETN